MNSSRSSMFYAGYGLFESQPFVEAFFGRKLQSLDAQIRGYEKVILSGSNIPPEVRAREGLSDDIGVFGARKERNSILPVKLWFINSSEKILCGLFNWEEVYKPTPVIAEGEGGMTLRAQLDVVSPRTIMLAPEGMSPYLGITEQQAIAMGREFRGRYPELFRESGLRRKEG